MTSPFNSKVVETLDVFSLWAGSFTIPSEKIQICTTRRARSLEISISRGGLRIEREFASFPKCWATRCTRLFRVEASRHILGYEMLLFLQNAFLFLHRSKSYNRFMIQKGSEYSSLSNFALETYVFDIISLKHSGSCSIALGKSQGDLGKDKIAAISIVSGRRPNRIPKPTIAAIARSIPIATTNLPSDVTSNLSLASVMNFLWYRLKNEFLIFTTSGASMQSKSNWVIFSSFWIIVFKLRMTESRGERRISPSSNALKKVSSAILGYNL